MRTRAPSSAVVTPEGARLVLATRNPGKLAELREILAPLAPGLDPESIISTARLGVPDPVEDGLTFTANAEHVHAQARVVGDDDANLRLLLAQIADVDDEHRGAHFTCAAVLVRPGAADDLVVERSMEGRLLRSPRGGGGFGYDPVFVPAAEDAPGGAGRTTAQMSAEQKNAISHRHRALVRLNTLLDEAGV